MPFIISGIHNLEEHKHDICTVKNVTHYHEADIDCDLYHFQITNSVLTTFLGFNINEYKIIKKVVLSYSFLIESNFNKTNKSRGPPLEIHNS